MKKSNTILIIGLFWGIVSCNPTNEKIIDEDLYLRNIKEDFLSHKEDVVTINEINNKTVLRIDSLFAGSRKDTFNTDLTKGIMNTRSYTLTILAYKNILNGNYISDDKLKIQIARHVAKFEGLALSKRAWDTQWDVTARPYLYKYGLLSNSKTKSNKNDLISNQEFRSILWDRRMFAHDVEIWTPRILSSADSIIMTIDILLQNK